MAHAGWLLCSGDWLVTESCCLVPSPQVWRLLTNFLFFGNFGIDYLFHMYFLYVRRAEIPRLVHTAVVAVVLVVVVVVQVAVPASSTTALNRRRVRTTLAIYRVYSLTESGTAARLKRGRIEDDLPTSCSSSSSAPAP